MTRQETGNVIGFPGALPRPTKRSADRGIAPIDVSFVGKVARLQRDHPFSARVVERLVDAIFARDALTLEWVASHQPNGDAR